ncbi:MAG: hypothetical protein ACYCQI_12600 [Gammaproteobacteria bacterium]
MPITFYPHEDDLDTSSIKDKLDTLLEAAERYKAVVLEIAKTQEAGGKKRTTPRDLTICFNWDEIARTLRQIRELPEATQPNKLTKAQHLTKLAEIYEVLRAAKMAKLEAVRIALMNEANQLRSSASQVA